MKKDLWVDSLCIYDDAEIKSLGKVTNQEVAPSTSRYLCFGSGVVLPIRHWDCGVWMLAEEFRRTVTGVNTTISSDVLVTWVLRRCGVGGPAILRVAKGQGYG